MRQSSENSQLARGMNSAGELYHPHYHFTPPANWMNDPNGLVYLNGEYHLFYQYNPDSPVWGPMYWGHAVSQDLVNWQHLPIALHPDEYGMIFSGSAVVDWKNTAGFGRESLVAIFTYHKDHIETQSLAYSTDQGRTWTKYADNPIISNPGLHDFRDPKIFWHEDHWVMALAARNVILFYTSPDLKHWEPSGSFGDGYGCTDGIRETPDLFQLNIEERAETRWVLTVGVSGGAPTGGSGTQYFVGTFDGQTFRSENPRDVILWADFGADYYAPQSWSDEPNGRRLMLGWMNNWQYATKVPTSTWRGALSTIRELSLTETDDEIRLVQKTIPELQCLRLGGYHWYDEVIQPGMNLLANVHGACLEIVAEFKLAQDVDCFGFRVRVGRDEQTTIQYDTKEEKLLVDRIRSGRTDFHECFASVHSAKLSPVKDVIRLHIFDDRSSVEVFANEGLVTFTENIFPAEQSQGLELFVEGGNILLTSLDVFQLKPAQFQVTEH